MELRCPQSHCDVFNTLAGENSSIGIWPQGLTARRSKLATMKPGPSPRAVIFDMDGTLLDTRKTVPDAIRATIRELTGKTCSYEDVFAVWSAGTVVATLTPLLGRPVTQTDVDAYLRHVDAGLAELNPYPGIRECLEALSARVPVGVFTGASRRVAELSLTATGLLPFITALLGGDEVVQPKPHPEGIVVVSRQLGVDVHEAAYVGDAPGDMLAARTAGALAVAATWGHSYDPTAPAEAAPRHPADLLDLLDRS